VTSPQQQPAAPPSSESAQAAQAALAALVLPALAKLWPAFLANPTQALPAFKAAVAVEVRSHAQASAALAQRQYRRQRTAAGETSTYRTTLATLPSVEDIGAMVEEALAGVDLSPAVPAPKTRGSVTEVAPEGTAVADAKARLAKAAEDVVFDTGARTVLGNIERDRQARGYARIPEAGACSFCLMLAIRGAVFKADRGNGQGDSFAETNSRKREMRDGQARAFRNGTVPSSIKVHDNCRCQPEPVFGVYEAPARVREAEALYETHVKDAGRKGKDARLAFRQAVEGREVTGIQRDTPTTEAKAKAKRPSKPGERTSAEIQAEIDALEQNLPRLTNDQQRAWTSKRIAALRQQLNT